MDESRTRNIAVVPNLTPVSSSWFTSWNNRISGSHDAVGNRSVYAGLNLYYDVENRQVEAKSGATTVATYDYDGEGRRVRKVVNNVETVFVYDAFGQLAQEYGGPAPSFTGRQYLFADHLGSTRAMAPATGNACGWWDFAPYGEKIAGTVNNRFGASGCTYGPSAEPAQQFTGKERDAETALDYFGARYYTGAQGRFMSPDQPLIDQVAVNPQSWNLYSYVRNNPLSFVDPTGQACVYTGPSGGDPNDPVNYSNDNNGGQSCEDAFASPAQQVTVGVGRDEANLIMLQGIGEGLSSPHEVATIASEAGQGAMALSGARALPSLGSGFVRLIRGPELIRLGLGGAAETANLTGLAAMGGLLRAARATKGNYGLGSASATEAEALGQAWVGSGYKVASDGKTLVSADGLRVYSPVLQTQLGQYSGEL